MIWLRYCLSRLDQPEKCYKFDLIGRRSKKSRDASVFSRDVRMQDHRRRTFSSRVFFYSSTSIWIYLLALFDLNVGTSRPHFPPLAYANRGCSIPISVSAPVLPSPSYNVTSSSSLISRLQHWRDWHFSTGVNSFALVLEQAFFGECREFLLSLPL